MLSRSKIPQLRAVDLGPLDVEIERGRDGAIYARAPFALPAYDDSVTARLDHWASLAPDRIFLAERDNHGGWRHLTFAEARAGARALGQAFLDRGLDAQNPLVILSGNSIAHALLGLAALYVGIPYAPISPAYALVSQDFAKLKEIIARLTPGLVFAQDGRRFGAAIKACVPDNVEILVGDAPLDHDDFGLNQSKIINVIASNNLERDAGGKPVSTFPHPALVERAASDFSRLLATTPTRAVEAAHAKVGADTIAKILFTSGSMAAPKGVVTNHRMLCANQAMIAHALPFLGKEPPVLVDWLPWHHSFGGNHNFGMALHHGGTLHIDQGRPTQAGIAETVRNLREISPTFFFNVPKGYEALLPYLVDNRALAENFFRSLKLAFFAGASLPPPMIAAFDAIATASCGERIGMISGFGATETAPSVLFHMDLTQSALDPTFPRVGLPLPGIALKLAPIGGKYEARVKGPNVTPGYWRDEDLTRRAFDAEGYYRLGDALSLADDSEPKRGFVFEGRIGEDFKLSSGTSVSVGPLRARIIAVGAPFLRDVVISGENRDALAALVFPDFEACRGLAPDLAAAAEPIDVLSHPVVRQKFHEIFGRLSAMAGGASERIMRAALLAEPPAIDAGEITDKGTINQRAVLHRRAEVVAALYVGEDSPLVVAVGARGDIGAATGSGTSLHAELVHPGYGKPSPTRLPLAKEGRT